MPVPAAHLAHFYSSADALAATLSSFFAWPLTLGESVIVVMRPEHRAALDVALAAAGVDLAAEVRAGRYVFLDVTEALAAFEAHGVTLEALALEARRRTSVVHVYTELTGALVARGDVAAAVQLETSWSAFVGRHPVRLVCGYPHDIPEGALATVLGVAATSHEAFVAAPREVSASVDLPGGPGTAERARRAVFEVLTAWDVAHEELLADVTVIVDELVGAAARRGAGGVTLTLIGGLRDVTVQVTALGGLDRPGAEGNVYAALDTLAQAWGVERLPDGARTWARLPV